MPSATQPAVNRPRRRQPYQLTAQGKASLQARARVTRPWAYTRGPKTAEGKLRSSRNATKHGRYSRQARLRGRVATLRRRLYAATEPGRIQQIRDELLVALHEQRRWEQRIGAAPTPADPPTAPAAPAAAGPAAATLDQPDRSRWLSVVQAAKVAGVSPGHLRRLLRSAELVERGLAACFNPREPWGGTAQWFVAPQALPELRRPAAGGRAD
ncbi:MAG: hypothetical protein WD009_06390 [Phycisphaeraceae bacterium]